MSARRHLWVVAGAVLLAACSSSTPEPPQESAAPPITVAPGVEVCAPELPEQSGVLRLGVERLTSLDPLGVSEPRQGEMIALDLLYDGLTVLDPGTALATPGLAERWEASEDLTEWTFTLCPDRVFQDGSPLGAEDVKRSLDRLAAAGPASLGGVRLEVVEGYAEAVDTGQLAGVSAPGPLTLVVRTTEPYGPLPELLASPFFGVVGPDAGAEPVPDGGPVGSGPFRVATLDDALVGLEATAGAPVALAGVELVQFDTVSDSLAAFRSGQVDWSLVPPDELGEVGDLDVRRWPFHVVQFFAFNLSHDSYADPSFRAALLHAVDRISIVEELHLSGSAMSGLIPAGVEGHVPDACGGACQFDPDAARELLTEAFPAGDTPTVRVDYYTGGAEEAVAAAVAEDLEDVGLTVELRPRTFDDYRAFAVSPERELFLFGWVGVGAIPDSFLAPLFLSGSPDNVTGHASDVVDAGLAAARAWDGRIERIEAYRAVEAGILGGVPILPLVQFETVAVVDARVTGLEHRLDGSFVVREVALSAAG